MHSEADSFQEALAQERLRLHGQATPGAVFASVAVGLALLVLVWFETPHQALLAWAGALCLALGARVGVWVAHRRAGADLAVHKHLWRYRGAYLLHGLVWSGLLLLVVRNPESMDAAVFVVMGMVGGALVTGSFDSRAAALFAVPSAGAILTHLLGLRGPAEPSFAAVAAVFLVIMLIASQRSARAMRRQVQADLQASQRLAEAQAQTARAELHAADAEHARRELAQVNEHTAQLLRGTRQGYWFVDPNGRTLDLNPSMCEMLGRPRDELMQLGVFDLFTGPELAVLKAELAQRRVGKVAGYEIDIVRPDGSRRHAFNQATPIYTADGTHMGSIGLWTDLTEQKKLELELRTYERVTNSITDVVSVVTPERSYRLVNDAWCRTVGVSREVALSRPDMPSKLGSFHTQRRHDALDACFATGAVQQVIADNTLPDGRHVTLHTTFYPYRDLSDAVGGVILITRDITEQERDRAALAASTEYLIRTLNATGDAIFASDADDLDEPVRFANEPLMRLWQLDGWTPMTVTPSAIQQAAVRLLPEPEAALQRMREIVAANRRHEDRLHLLDGRVLLRHYEPALVAGRRLRVWSFRDVTTEEQARALLQDREAQQRALLDAFPGYISRFDAELNYTYVNRPLADLAGRKPEALLGLPVEAVIGRKRAVQFRASVKEVLAGRPVVLEREYHGPQGSVTVQMTLASGRDPQTGAPIVYAFGADISGLKKAEQALRDSEQELRMLLESFPGPMVSVDEEGRYRYVGPKLAALLQRPVDEIAGRTLSEVLGPALGQTVWLEHCRARAGEVVRVDRRYDSAESGPLDIEVTHVAGPPGPDGRQTVYTFSLDVTSRNRALDALAAARDEAERANQAKSQFLSHMSHELRTPMNAILGFAQLLQRDQRPPLAAHQRGYARQILRGAEHLLELINEVLDLGRIESGRLRLEPSAVDVADVVGDVLALVRELARSHDVRIRPPLGLEGPKGEPAGPHVVADRTRLRQVVLNLVGNAIKYNRPDGEVQVRCRREGHQVVIEVQDTGRGIDEALQRRLFQPFERLGAENSTIEGTGIGLALSRRLVLAMGGEIGVHSQPGAGSTFWVRLPAPAGATTPAGGLAAEAAQGQTALADTRSTVLYIDDNEVNVLLVEAMLAHADGVRLVSTSKPAMGLAMAQHDPPSLVLLDIHMPDMDGFEVLARLRAHPATAGIPVVAVSADAMPSDMDAARAAGFAAYLTKPLDFDALLQTVQRLSQRGQNPDTRAP